MRRLDAQRTWLLYRGVESFAMSLGWTVAAVFFVTDLGVLDALAFGVALLLGAAMIYSFWLVIATGAFWVVNMWHVADLFDGVFQTGRWPIGIYPGWLRYSVTFLVPVAFAVTVPAQAVTSRLQWQTFALAVVFAAVLFAFTRWFWRVGLRRYSGASA